MRRLLLLAALSLALIGCSDKGTKAGGEQLSAGDLAAGKAIADRDCKGCHGLDGKGTAPGIPNLAGQRAGYLAVALAEYKDGKRVHAALRDIAAHLNETETRNVAGYYASLPPIAPAIGPDAMPPSPYERGKTLASACEQCHGPQGNSTTAGVPSLAGQQPRYFYVATQEYLTGLRGKTPMHMPIRDLSRQDLESLALYFASQTPTQREAPKAGDPAIGEPKSALCGGCHGSHGVSSDSATPTLAAQDAEYLVHSMKAYRQDRKHAAMQKAVAELTDQDIVNIAAFYSVQKSKPAEKGETLVKDTTEKGDRCHTPQVENPSMPIPIIRAQDKDYLTMALRAYHDDRRESTMMHKMSLPYSESIIDSLAAFYASQPAK